MTTFKDLGMGAHGEILIRAASEDWREFYRLRRACRDFFLIPAKQILKHVSLKNYDHYSWDNGDLGFKWFDHCVSAGNVEALFRKALEEFGKVEEGEKCLELLKVLIQNTGYTPAVYAYGLLNLFYGHREEGMKTLTAFRGSLSFPEFNHLILDCREKTLKVLSPENRPWYFQTNPVQDLGLLVCKCKSNCVEPGYAGALNPRANLCTCYETCFWDHECRLVTVANAYIPY